MVTGGLLVRLAQLGGVDGLISGSSISSCTVVDCQLVGVCVRGASVLPSFFLLVFTDFCCHSNRSTCGGCSSHGHPFGRGFFVGWDSTYFRGGGSSGDHNEGLWFQSQGSLHAYMSSVGRLVGSLRFEVGWFGLW